MMKFNPALKVLIVLISVSTLSCGGDGSKDDPAPRVLESAKAEEEMIVPAVVNASEIAALKKGDTYELAINDSISFNITIARKSEYVKGLTSLSGYINGEREGSAMITVQEDTVIANIQYPGLDWFYSLSYDRSMNRHELAKVYRDSVELDRSEPLKMDGQ